jgi:hypothetical protein
MLPLLMTSIKIKEDFSNTLNQTRYRINNNSKLSPTTHTNNRPNQTMDNRPNQTMDNNKLIMDSLSNNPICLNQVCHKQLVNLFIGKII